MSHTERAFVRKAASLVAAPADWRDTSEKTAGPVRVHLVRLPARTTAKHALGAVMALHASAVAHNLACVLTSLDPEGPHQLRIALRRTRVVLRVFRPVMKKKANAELTVRARELGAIVGELRDADVLIDEIIAPVPQGDLMPALNAWRQEVRGRVRAKLSAAAASGLPQDIARDAAAGAWCKKSDAADLTLEAAIGEALQEFRDKAAEAAARLPNLSPLELHQLRKDVKAIRYGTELACAAGLATPEDVRPLKRLQDLLGYANDMASLANFDPPIFAERQALRQIRERLIGERAERVSSATNEAAMEWRELARTWTAERSAKI